jgi:quinol monooxygenase YgiN
MNFTPAGADEFLSIFRENMPAIRAVAGCSHLELLKDPDRVCTYTTLSYWEGPQYLEMYRQSELFGKVWQRVKVHFAARPEAFSLERFIVA